MLQSTETNIFGCDVDLDNNDNTFVDGRQQLDRAFSQHGPDQR